MRIIAHRGASAYSPENTIEAFRLALEMGSADFEFDVHRTKDGVLAVCHNYFVLDRSEQKVFISKTSFEELRKIDVSRLFIGSDFHCIPSFEEVLDTIADRSQLINIEIKNERNIYPGIEDQILKIIKERDLSKKVLISSFDYGTLQRMRNISPTIPIGMLVHGLDSIFIKNAIKKAKDIKAENIHIDIRTACKKHVSAIREAGFRCFVYTVNKRKDAERLKSYGVDGIFSNHPDILGDWKLKP